MEVNGSREPRLNMRIFTSSWCLNTGAILKLSFELVSLHFTCVTLTPMLTFVNKFFFIGIEVFLIMTVCIVAGNVQRLVEKTVSSFRVLNFYLTTLLLTFCKNPQLNSILSR